jgi:ankyrin repeat protein
MARTMKPIHLCCLNGNIQILKILIEKGCDLNSLIDTKLDKGVNCLHLAAGYGHVEICKLLIEEYKFDPLLKTELNKSDALSFAINRYQVEVLKYFLEKGIDTSSLVLGIAIRRNDEKLLQYLNEKYGNDK